MIVRIVQMTFRENAVKDFTDLFDERMQTIRAFRGCTHLELWQDTERENVFFTYSIWQSQTDLDHYRFSNFFKDTWGKAKALFSEKPKAWSVAVRAKA